MTNDVWTIHENGSFDLHLGGITLQGAYPALDDRPLRPLAVSIERSATGGTLTYTLAAGRSVTVSLSNDHGPGLQATLHSFDEAPRVVQPLHGATPVGLDRFFRQGLGFGGPSGFVSIGDLGEADASLESAAVCALVAKDDGTLAVGPMDHTTLACRFALGRRRHTHGLVSRDTSRTTLTFEASFSTERIPVPSEFPLPAIRFIAADHPWSALRQFANGLAEQMHARPQSTNAQPPAWHWCSWYRYGCNFNHDLLVRLLEEVSAVKPPLELQTIQIDDGICDSPGDWLIPSARWPHGAEGAFSEITRRGFRAGIWIAPFMVGNRSRLAAEHPEWLLRNADGSLVTHWKNYDAHGIPSHLDEETYNLDTTHPEAFEYIVGIFRQMREWGATFFKTDFMDWGLRDATLVRRHAPVRRAAALPPGLRSHSPGHR